MSMTTNIHANEDQELEVDTIDFGNFLTLRLKCGNNHVSIFLKSPTHLEKVWDKIGKEIERLGELVDDDES